MILVAIIHTRRARHHCRKPDFMMSRMVLVVKEHWIEAMGLDVCLVNDVEPVVIAQLVPAPGRSKSASKAR